MEELTQQEQEFVKEVAVTGNQTKAIKKAYGITNDGYARKKGSELVTKRNIATALAEVKRTLAERIPDELLERIHLEGLEAKNEILDKDGNTLAEKPDYAVRHKYLDSAYKLKGVYAPEKRDITTQGEKLQSEIDLELLAETMAEKLKEEKL